MLSTKVSCAFLHYCLDKYVKGTVENGALSSLHGGSLEITVTFPLIII